MSLADHKRFWIENSAMSSKYIEKITRFLRDESGPTAIEYALILAFIFLVCITVVAALGQQTSVRMSEDANTIGEYVGGN